MDVNTLLPPQSQQEHMGDPRWTCCGWMVATLPITYGPSITASDEWMDGWMDTIAPRLSP